MIEAVRAVVANGAQHLRDTIGAQVPLDTSELDRSIGAVETRGAAGIE